jgi:hypothetical protein
VKAFVDEKSTSTTRVVFSSTTAERMVCPYIRMAM